MASTVKHFQSINSAIKPGDWDRIRLSVDRVSAVYRSTEVLKNQTSGLISNLGKDKFEFRLNLECFSIKRKWPRDWYGACRISSVYNCSEGFDLFQRACLIIASRFARDGGAGFVIATEGSLEGWRYAARIAALATGDPIYGEQDFLKSLPLSGALIPEAGKDKDTIDRSDWAPAKVDDDLIALAASVLEPSRGPLPWPVSHSWFF